MNHYQPILNRKIRIAIVGCGRIAENHFASIAKHSDDFELVALCDNDQTHLDQAQAKHGGTPYLSLTDMLANETLDMVSICTPSGVHPQQAIEIAEAGVHVISEKPMATRWQDGIDMVKACDRAGVRLLIVKQNRRNTTLQLLKRAIDEGRFGRIYMERRAHV